jgi:DNA gyrase/topoisomerase IV subunit A
MDFELKRLRDRHHIIAGLLSALDNWTAVSDLIADCDNRSEAIQALTTPPFSFSELQATHVVDSRLSMRTGHGRRALQEERDEVLAAIQMMTGPAGSS